MRPCPDVAGLRQLLADQLSGSDRADLEAHLDVCEPCQERLAELSHDAAVDPWRAARTNGRRAGGPEPPADFLRRLEESNPVAGPRASAERLRALTGERIEFPDPPTETGPLGRLGAYHVIELLGCGAAGQVFKAWDDDLKRLVAIKVLRADLAASPASCGRFLREAQAAAAVRHDHVTTIHHVGTFPGNGPPFIVMEHIEGETLGRLLERRQALAPNEAVALVRQVAQGLAFAHERGLVHRDIKPSNILIERTTGQAKVADFGLARVVLEADKGGKRRLTYSGLLVGTPAYMSPEQILHPDHVDGRSDVYSLGVLLYELLTGRPPFQGTVYQILQAILNEKPPPPRLLKPDLPPALETVVLTCLAKEPEQRYRTAGELIVDLDRWRDGEAIRARPLRKFTRLARWCRRNPALTAACGVAGTAVLASILLGLFFARSWSDLTAQRNAAQRQTEAVRREKQELRAGLARDRGLALCEQGDAAQGLLWLARALELAPAGADELQWGLRAQLAVWRRRVHALRTVLPHDGAVYAVAFSLDGKRILTGSERWAAHLWETATGRAVAVVNVGAPVTAVAFSPNGQTVLVGQEKGSVHVREIDAEARTKDSFPDYWLAGSGAVIGIASRPDGRQIVTAVKDPQISLYDMATGKPSSIPVLLPSPLRAFALSPDGHTLLTGHDDRTARLWDLSTCKPQGSSFAHAGEVRAVAFHPQGRLLATGSADHTARIWDRTTGHAAGPPLGHKDKVYAVAFSRDGQTLVTAGKDQTARLWEVATGQPLGAPLWHAGSVYAAALHPDGRTVLTGSEDGGGRLWELPGKGEPLVHALAHEDMVKSAAFHPDGRSFVTGGDDARFHALGTGQPQPGLLHWGGVDAVAFRADGRVVLTGGADRSARLWDAATGRLLGSPLVHPGHVHAVAFSPDGQTLLTGCEDHRARLWDATTGKLKVPPLPHRGAVTAVAFSPDGQTVLTGCWDGTAQLWDTATAQPIGEPIAHRGAVTAVAFRPDGQRFLTASRDSTVHVWNTATRQRVLPPLVHAQPVLTAAFSPDGRMVLTGAQDRTARLWEAATGRPLGPALSHPDFVRAVAFSPDGRTALIAGDAKTAQLWNLPAPVAGEVERLVLWVQVITNLTLDEHEHVQPLDVKVWQEKRQRLDELGGPPP